jgi:probable HAF family extracellular repeat protein
MHPIRAHLASATRSLLAIAMVSVVVTSIASAQPHYSLSLVHPPLPFDYAVPNGINGAGHLVGYAVINSTSEFHAFVLKGGVFQDLGLLGYGGTTAIGINATDQLALDGEGPGEVALFSSGGVTHRIGSVDGGSSWVYAINDLGDVVGSARNGDGNIVGFSWFGGAFTDLTTLSPGIYRAAAINDARQIAGSIGYYWGGGGYLHGQAHACLYSGGVVTDLGSISGNPRSDTEAYGIDGAGDVVGYSTAADGTHHAFLYRGGVLQDLGTLPDAWATATAINGAGLIAGTLTNPYGATLGSFLYAGGAMFDLGPLLTNGDGWSQLTVTGINDAGAIVGYGTLDGTTQGFVAEPTTTTGVTPPVAAIASEISEPRPNPSTGAAEIAFTLSARAADGDSRLEIFDAQGRRVATLARGSLGAGSHDARWDGREAGGAGAPAGLYVARLTTCEGSLSRRLLLAR